jgi:hypothetical protein
VDLREPDEIAADSTTRPDEITTVNTPLDGKQEDPEFWTQWEKLSGSPSYYAAYIARYPHRVAAALQAIAHAPEGAVLYHCAAGKDRTGLISIIVYRLAGVDDEHILDDYLLSITNHDLPGWTQLSAERLAELRVEYRALLATFLADFDAQEYVSAAGVSEETIAALRQRIS